MSLRGIPQYTDIYQENVLYIYLHSNRHVLYTYET